MKSISATWFESKVSYEKTMESGELKRVVETFVVDALSWGEAEKRITEEMEVYTKKEVIIKDLSIAQYNEIFFADDSDESSDKWYKAKIQLITVDSFGKEKGINQNYLVQADSMSSALRNINEAMKGTMADYKSVSLNETSIVDVFRYVKA